jgi:hypothetical protein
VAFEELADVVHVQSRAVSVTFGNARESPRPPEIRINRGLLREAPGAPPLLRCLPRLSLT